MLPAGLMLVEGVNCVSVPRSVYYWGFGAGVRQLTQIVPLERTGAGGDQWPVRALKVAKMVFTADSRLALFPLVYHVEHTVDGVARCAVRASSSVPVGHVSPALGECNCGFHALSAGSKPGGVEIGDELARQSTSVVLDVELGGRIIQGRDRVSGLVKGWRASRQRILAVYVPSRCWGLMPSTRPGVVARCSRAATCVTRGSEPTAHASTERKATPACDKHADPLFRWPLADLAGVWGTEVGWWPHGSLVR